MNTLFVSNEYPFPARNGVTLPLSNYAKLFREHCGPVDLLFLRRESESVDYRQANVDFFENVFELPIKSKGFANRILGQWTGRSAFFSGWTPAVSPPPELLSRDYQYVVSSPRAVCETVHNLRLNKYINARFHAAVVHDIAALAKKNLTATALKSGKSIKHLSHALKLSSQRLGLARVEKKLLTECCDVFVVQSEAEMNWVRSQNSPALEKNAIQLSNGVDEAFFEVSLKKPERTCTFVGGISGEYLKRARWLVDEVWEPIKKSFPDSKFTISGKCQNEEMLKLFAKQSINHRQFVDDPRDLYSDQSVLLAPIFKGYGLINKVVQCLAAGTIVIGDPTAFNAIPGFVAGKHGVVADSPSQFVKLLTQVFEQPERFEDVRVAARQLMLENFQWETRYQQLEFRLQSLTG